MSIYSYRIKIFLASCLLFLSLALSEKACAQIREATESDNAYILSRFPYPKTEKFEEIYCHKYPEDFECKKIGLSPGGMFPKYFNLTDDFFVKLLLRPIDQRNYDALNIAGLYLRSKRPAKNEISYEYTFLDIEFEHFTERVYYHNKKFSFSNPDEVEFRLAFLDLIEENLFINPEQVYINELSKSNNFQGSYYALSRMFFTNTLVHLRQIEQNKEVLHRIQELLRQVPETNGIE